MRCDATGVVQSKAELSGFDCEGGKKVRELECVEKVELEWKGFAKILQERANSSGRSQAY